MADVLKLGMIGLDTSHVTAFTKLLNDPAQQYHIPGGKVVVGFPGGSPDFELSISRVQGFTDELSQQYQVAIVESPEEVAELSDAIFLESADGRVHLEQFRRIAPYGKPVFVDKPFAVTTEDAREMIQLAKQYHVPLMSCSALRYAEGLKEAIAAGGEEAIIGADTFGPMAIVPPIPGYFWYGIHSAEMLFAILGKGCKRVTTYTSEDHDIIVGEWADGRKGTVRGNRKGNNSFGATIHFEKSTKFADVYANPKPYYASMLEVVMELFQKGIQPIDLEETLEIVRFLEAANESRETGLTVIL